jgi:formylglycine-generating enzyme required for sulfatase activity
VGPFPGEGIPDELAVFHAFRFPEDVGDIVRWASAGSAAPDDSHRVPDADPRPEPPPTLPPPPSPPPPSPPRPPEPVAFRWRAIPAGPYRAGFTPGEIEEVLAQIQDPSFDLDAIRTILRAEPARSVEVPAFELSAELVTNAQFGRFVEATGHRTTAERNGDRQSWRTHGGPERAEHPVILVSFEDAEAFCRWAGARLPRLHEWTKAYRGPNGNVYPWGNRFDPGKCNTQENRTVQNTSPVTTFAAHASPYGCLDMIGNVSEWVDATGDTGPLARGLAPEQLEQLRRTRAIMGGAWDMTCQAFGLPIMNIIGPVDRYSNDLGFRVAR